MSKAYNTRLLPERIRTNVDPTATYSTFKFGATDAPLLYAPRLIKFTNLSDTDCLISWDGVVDHEILPANGFVLLDVAANKQQANTLYIAAQTQFYVKTTSGTATGTVYLSSYYA